MFWTRAGWLLAVWSVGIMGCVLTTDSLAQQPFAIAIHGGAGGDPASWSEEYRQARLDSLNELLDLGEELLSERAMAIEVVEQVIRRMEDNEIFNAGRGCVLNAQGEHELDASIMDGSDLSCGAVAGVSQTRHPISLAIQVMRSTRHVLLSGPAADQFAESLGLEQATAEHFVTPRQHDAWKAWQRRDQQSAAPKPLPGEAEESRRGPFVSQSNTDFYFGTVGCVVLDQSGNLAAGTSTGGLMGKRWGRVGDSPIIGAGNYADNPTCAVSGTGVGEEFIRRSIASDIAARMRYADQGLSDAANGAIDSLPDNCGGVICVDRQGTVTIACNTPGMSHAYRDADGGRGVGLVSSIDAPPPER